MTYLNENSAYIYGGGYGDVPFSIGAYVDQVSPDTLEHVWHTQLIDTHHNGEWDYPGSLGILEDGYLYVSYGYRLAKLDPATGKVISTLMLPTGDGLPENTSFNGFNATADGTIIGNAANQFSIQPFLGDPIPPLIATTFSPAISWAPMSVSGDSDTNLIYASDALPGKIAVISISDSGLQVVWKADQRTTEFTALINPLSSRVVVGTDIPDGEIPGNNHHDYSVWRNALTGEEIAHSPLLPAMTRGTMILKTPPKLNNKPLSKPPLSQLHVVNCCD